MSCLLLSSDSESDLELLGQLSDWSDEDINTQQRRSQRRIRRVNYMESLDDGDFTFRFRINKSTFSSLLLEVTPLLRVSSTRNDGVSAMHQLLLTLRFFALGTMLISVADFVGVSKSTAGRIVRDTSSAIARLYDKYIYMHLQSADKFYRIAGFPRVLGAIDGTHIRIQSPSHLIGEEFRNRKGFFSLNVQGVCDADLKFINVVARWPGSTHDATMFNNSVLRAQCDAGQFRNRWLLGDSAYPNRSYLLTPLLNPVTQADHRYNEAHIKTRNLVERTFGVWKRRFPVVGLTMRLSLPNIQAVIVATAVLHNVCRNNNLAEIPSEVELPTIDNDIVIPQNVDVQDVPTVQRSDLINNYFTTL